MNGLKSEENSPNPKSFQTNQFYAWLPAEILEIELRKTANGEDFWLIHLRTEEGDRVVGFAFSRIAMTKFLFAAGLDVAQVDPATSFAQAEGKIVMAKVQFRQVKTKEGFLTTQFSARSFARYST